MARFIYEAHTKDGAGKIIPSATVAVYLAGTTTVASIYSAYSGGTAVNSVTSGTDGKFTFYVDDTVYASSQQFKIVMSKSGYTSQTYDYISIFPRASVYIGTLEREMDAATGAVAYTGVGFLPSHIVFLGVVSTAAVSVGIDDGTTHYNVNVSIAATSVFAPDSSNSICLTESAGKTQTAVVSALGADGFTLTWTRTGATASATATIYYLALR